MLIKFFEEQEHAKEFLAGKLYLNTVAYFKEREASQDGRGDRFEIPSQWWQSKDVSIEFGDTTMEAPSLTGQVVIQHDDHDSTNLLCMYAGTEDQLEIVSEGTVRRHRVPEKCLKMGRRPVLVRNVPEFFRRFDAEMARLKVDYFRGLVRYFDRDTFSGKLDDPVIWKSNEFEWQREYRFGVVAPTQPPGPLRVEIGSLLDICTFIEDPDVLADLKLRLVD